MDNNIIHTIHKAQKVSSAYAEIYLDDIYCDEKTALRKSDPKPKVREVHKDKGEDDWSSPSDLLIGIVALKPPFTSKTTRGVTHKGILAIGNTVLETEQVTFLKQLNILIQENDAAWNDILEHEKQQINNQVNEIYQTLFNKKSKIMTAEIGSFYERSLQDLEVHIRSQVQNVLVNAHARIISNLNVQIKNKLCKEKNTLEKKLKAKFNAEEEKLKKYYKLLVQNELHRNNTLVHSVASERNEALNAFFRQLEMENITNTMYVLSTERKRCKIKKFIIENYQNTEISEKLNKVKERQIIIDAYKKEEIHISDINKEWEEKIKKILQLFLKFISFSLKLLPEQTTFLMDFENMIVLQLNEMIQKPQNASSILVEKEDLDNIFKFSHLQPKELICDTEPIVVTGNLEDLTPPSYGSRETLASNVDLPTIRLQRQFIYAKCHEYEEIKRLLESQRCKCNDIPQKEPSHISLESESNEPAESRPSTSTVSESSNEPLLVNDINRLYECPVRKCTDWVKRYSFPCLESYLDFSEENFSRVQDLLGKPSIEVIMPELLDTKTIIHTELPFASTKERCHNIATQYSSHQNECVPSLECPCMDNVSRKTIELSKLSKETETKDINSILMQRRNSIKTLLHQHSKLLKMFTDESFDFIM